MQPSFGRELPRSVEKLVRPIEVPESGPAYSHLEVEVDEDVWRHARLFSLAPVAPAREPDAISPERGTMHQLDQGVLDGFVRTTAAHNFGQRAL
ncbi:MAG TPA: hypothetical protein VKH65_00140, partial [Myxococcales bacterium]|nr:hypothetical protein [Myxococcales bacterium]